MNLMRLTAFHNQLVSNENNNVDRRPTSQAVRGRSGTSRQSWSVPRVGSARRNCPRVRHSLGQR